MAVAGMKKKCYDGISWNAETLNQDLLNLYVLTPHLCMTVLGPCPDNSKLENFYYDIFSVF